MKKKDPRTFAVKGLMRADEVLAFSRACDEADVSQSAQIRVLINGWVAQRNGRGAAGPGGSTEPGKNLAMFLPKHRIPLVQLTFARRA